MNTATPDDTSLASQLVAQPTLPSILFQFSQADCDSVELKAFVRNLAQTLASEARGIVEAKAPNGEIRLVVSLQ